MLHLVKAVFHLHPWLTGLEALVGLVALVDIVLLGVFVLAWVRCRFTSWMDARRGSTPYRGYAPDTFASDARFFVTAGMVALMLAGIVLALAGGIGWAWTALRGGEPRAFIHAIFGGTGLTLAALAWIIAARHEFGGGILPS